MTDRLMPSSEPEIKVASSDPRQAINRLARLMYEELEFLGPSSPEPLVNWDKLTQWQRSLYVNCIERLLEEGELIDRARKFADDDVAPRTAYE